MVLARTLLASVLALLFVGASPAAAQTSYITGTVTDIATGARLPDVQVVAYLGAATTAAGSARSDESGQYRINNVAPGNYRVVFTRVR